MDYIRHKCFHLFCGHVIEEAGCEVVLAYVDGVECSREVVFLWHQILEQPTSLVDQMGSVLKLGVLPHLHVQGEG